MSQCCHPSRSIQKSMSSTCNTEQWCQLNSTALHKYKYLHMYMLAEAYQHLFLCLGKEHTWKKKIQLKKVNILYSYLCVYIYVCVWFFFLICLDVFGDASWRCKRPFSARVLAENSFISSSALGICHHLLQRLNMRHILFCVHKTGNLWSYKSVTYILSKSNWAMLKVIKAIFNLHPV